MGMILAEQRHRGVILVSFYHPSQGSSSHQRLLGQRPTRYVLFMFCFLDHVFALDVQSVSFDGLFCAFGFCRSIKRSHF